MKRSHYIAVISALLILLAAGFAVLYPLLTRGFFVSDDGGWMIIRLSAFFQSWREGQFPVRFLGRLNYSYGYPVANFLYPGFLYLGSLIHAAGFGFIDTVKIILGGAVLTGGFFTFFWLKQYFRTSASLIGAIHFLFAPYLLFDLYTRGSVGEILALAFAPMGLYAIAARKPWLLGLAVSLLIVSHNSLAILFIGFYAVYITVRGAWRDHWLMFLLGIGMAAFFWFPALYERKYVAFDAVRVSNPAAYFVTMSNATLLGLSGIIAAMIALFIPKPPGKEKALFLLFFAATLFIVLPVSGFVWRHPALTQMFQFPYRFLSLAIFIGCWLTAYVLAHMRTWYRLALSGLFVGIGLWVVAGAIQNIHHIQLPEGYYVTNEATTTVQDEYMPRWVEEKPSQRANERLIYHAGAGTFEVKRVTTQSVDVVVHATKDSVIQVNTIYYPGWGATVDGSPVAIDYKNRQGVMRIAVPQGEHRLIAGFRETVSRFLADSVSLGCFIWYIGAVLVSRRKPEAKKRKT